MPSPATETIKSRLSMEKRYSDLLNYSFAQETPKIVEIIFSDSVSGRVSLSVTIAISISQDMPNSITKGHIGYLNTALANHVTFYLNSIIIYSTRNVAYLPFHT